MGRVSPAGNDPPLPLGKMRAAKKLIELRIAQLRFTEAEAGALYIVLGELYIQQGALSKAQACLNKRSPD
jgi:ATP-dependent transcriptional regulator